MGVKVRFVFIVFPFWGEDGLVGFDLFVLVDFPLRIEAESVFFFRLLFVLPDLVECVCDSCDCDPLSSSLLSLLSVNDDVLPSIHCASLISSSEEGGGGGAAAGGGVIP